MSRFFTIMILLVACGSSDEPTGSSTSGGEDDGPCATELSECYDEAARASCLEIAETCPPAQILVLESCPVQYACEDAAADPDDGHDAVASGDTCQGYSVTDSCMDEDNFAQCQRVTAECDGPVAVLESCPLQFACQ